MSQDITNLRKQFVGKTIIYKGKQGVVKSVKMMAEPMALVDFAGRDAILKVADIGMFVLSPTPKFISRNDIIEVPREVAVCRICDADIVIIDTDEYEKNDDGTWQISECRLHVDCSSAPDIDSDEWDDWFNGHWGMPYVDWLPVERRVHDWLAANYRFKDIGSHE